MGVLGKLSGLGCRVAFFNLAVMHVWSGCKSPQVRAIMVAACGTSRAMIGFGAQHWGSGLSFYGIAGFAKHCISARARACALMYIDTHTYVFTYVYIYTHK